MVHRRRTIFKVVRTTKLSPLVAWYSRKREDHSMVLYFTPSLQNLVLICSLAPKLLSKPPNTAKPEIIINWPISSSLSVRRRNRKPQISRSILAQLLEQIDIIPATIQAFYEQYQHGVPSERGVMNSIRDLITKSQTYIIVDALDECPNTEDERAELCNILKTMHSWNCERLHILVTSRKEADLMETLQPIVTQKPIGIQGSVIDTDIRRFVRTQLQVNSRLSKLSGELRAEIEQTLVKNSGRM
jgi:hypothetical protein